MHNLLDGQVVVVSGVDVAVPAQEAEVAVKQAQAQKYGADAAETQADTQIAQQMAPLDAQHLLAQIAKLIAETISSGEFAIKPFFLAQY